MFVEHARTNDIEEVDKLRIIVPRILDDAELMNAAGCVGYAVKQYSGENGTGDPYDVFRLDGKTAFTLDIYSRVDFEEYFFCAVEDYLREGTPVRQTNRAGPGTMGTRLVPGMGVTCEVWVWVPDTSTHELEIKVDGKPVYRAKFMSSRGNKEAALASALGEYISGWLHDRR